MKKKILISSGFVFLILVGILGWLAYPFIAFFYYASESVSEEVAKSYMKETYGVDIKVVDKKSNAIELGETRFEVIPKGEEDMKFTLVFSTTDDSLISEDYRFAVQAQEEFMKLDNEWPVIKELGFEPAMENGDEQAFFFYGDFITLNLMTKDKIEAPPLKVEDLERLYRLTMSVLSSGAMIDNIFIRSSVDEGSIEIFVVPLAAVNLETTKADFLIMLKREHPELAAYEIQQEWEQEARKVENERFQFKVDGFDYWVFCDVVEETGECLTPEIRLTYAEDELKQSNPHLKKDLEDIFNFIDKNLQPGMKAGIFLTDEQHAVFIEHDERKTYQNTAELISTLFVE